MTIPPTGGAGVPAAPTAGAAPFAVTAPPELALAPGDRMGSTSFTITNLTGRPVRARLRPRGRMGAPDTWFSVAGLVEVPMGVAATITATVNVAVPPEAPAGAAQFFLEVVAEDDTESVAGQTVAFAVPPPPVPPSTRKFPWWIVVVGVLVLALIVGGVILILRGSDDPSDPPVNGIAPSIFGTAQVGRPLAADNGNWRPTEGIAFEQQWRRCDPSGGSCVDIPGATEQIYVPVAADEGSTLRVTVTATTGGGKSAEESKAVGPVAAEQRPSVPPSKDLVIVPALTNLSTSEAAKVAAASGLRTRVVFNGAVCISDAVISDQSPQPGSSVSRNSTVQVFVPSKNPRECLVKVPR